MTTFNYVTSNGKILNVDTENLSQEGKTKLKKTFSRKI